MTDFENEMDYIYADLRHMLIGKHKNYGEDNLKKHGLRGIVVRIDDKMSRVNNMMNNTKDLRRPLLNPNIRDQFMDIAGYCLQALRLMNEEENDIGMKCDNCRENERHLSTRYCIECLENNAALSHLWPQKDQVKTLGKTE